MDPRRVKHGIWCVSLPCLVPLRLSLSLSPHKKKHGRSNNLQHAGGKRRGMFPGWLIAVIQHHLRSLKLPEKGVHNIPS